LISARRARPVMKGLERIRQRLSFFRPGDFAKWILLGGVVGLISGLAASAFFYGLGWAEYLLQDLLAGYPTLYPSGEHPVAAPSGTSPRPLVFLLLPALGGLVSGLLVYLMAPEAAGAGTNAMIEAFHNAAGHIRARVPLVKGLASILTLAANGSAGRQGPIIQVGAGLGSCLGRLFGLTVKDRRLMLLAGAAGGLSALFRAPMGSAVVSAEVLYGDDIETEGLIPCIVSAVVSYVVFAFFFGHEAIFYTPEFRFEDPGELVCYAALGLLCVPVGQFYIRFFFGVRDRLFGRIKAPVYLKPAIGGALVGMVGLVTPQALGIGYGWLQRAILGELAIGLMAAIMFFKVLSTSFTISSGGSGGVFAPSLFIGGMLGGVVGGIGHLLFPQVVQQPGAYVLVGMAGFFAGVAKAPIGSILMVCEMTGGYHLLVPLLLVSAIHVLFNRRISIYESQVPNRFASPAHLSEMTVNILREIRVAEVLDRTRSPVVLRQDTTFKALREVILETDAMDYPVVDEAGHLTGLLSVNAVRKVLLEDQLGDLVVVGEIASKPCFVTTDEDLHSALMKFLDSGHDQLPVLGPQAGPPILGMLRHEDVISAYHRELTSRQSPQG